MVVCMQLRLRLLQLRASWEGCNNRAAVAGSILASLATLVFCVAYGSIFCSSTCSWISPEVHKVPNINRGLLPLAAPTTLATHAPYSTEPPSFLTSPGYQGICNSTTAQQQGCAVRAVNATSHEQAQPCTPDSLRQWGGTGSWSRDEGGHFKCAPFVVAACSMCGRPGNDAGGAYASDFMASDRRYEPSHCRLRRLDVQQARQCLDNKRLAFVSGAIFCALYSDHSCTQRPSITWPAEECCANAGLSCIRLQVGDSLLRYQYLSLAHFMAHGVWPER
jgi:hypothetical protein